MNTNDLFKQMALHQWSTVSQQIEKTINSISDEQYSTPIVSGGASVAWVICHLVYTNNNLFPILGIGPEVYPQLDKIMSNKQTDIHSAFSGREVGSMWTNVNGMLLQYFHAMSGDQWLEKHTAVSEEDFNNEPHRNKFNVILSRLVHMSHHAGQLSLIK